MGKKYILKIDGPDAEPDVKGQPETIELSNGTTACNMYARLAANNHVTLRAPNGTEIDSRVTPDPWGAALG